VARRPDRAITDAVSHQRHVDDRAPILSPMSFLCQAFSMRR
jgi:hypothetical protein